MRSKWILSIILFFVLIMLVVGAASISNLIVDVESAIEGGVQNPSNDNVTNSEKCFVCAKDVLEDFEVCGNCGNVLCDLCCYWHCGGFDCDYVACFECCMNGGTTAGVCSLCDLDYCVDCYEGMKKNSCPNCGSRACEDCWSLMLSGTPCNTCGIEIYEIEILSETEFPVLLFANDTTYGVTELNSETGYYELLLSVYGVATIGCENLENMEFELDMSEAILLLDASFVDLVSEGKIVILVNGEDYVNLCESFMESDNCICDVYPG